MGNMSLVRLGSVRNGVGQPVYKADAKSDVILVGGERILDQDTDEIFRAWELINAEHRRASTTSRSGAAGSPRT